MAKIPISFGRLQILSILKLFLFLNSNSSIFSNPTYTTGSFTKPTHVYVTVQDSLPSETDLRKDNFEERWAASSLS